MSNGDILAELIELIQSIEVPNASTLELELRFNVDARKDKKSYGDKSLNAVEAVNFAKKVIGDNQSGRCEIEQSINFINDNHLVKQLIFINGVQKKDKQKHYNKDRLIRPIIAVGTMPEYTINLSFEHAIKEFAITECKEARIRLRFSVYLEQWRLDITLIKTANINDANELKASKEQMLFPITTDAFVEKAPWNLADYVEFEMEYVDDPSKLTIESLKFANDYLTNKIDEIAETADVDDTQTSKTGQASNAKYQQKIYEVAKWIVPKNANMFRQKFGMKQLSNQAIEMDKNIYLNEVHRFITDYYITDKVDGKRAILCIDKSGAYALTDKLTMIDAEKISDSANRGLVYIFDCEEYFDSMADSVDTKVSTTPIYYIFDVMVWESKVITDEPFHKRLEYFTRACKLTNDLIHEKPFIRLTPDYRKQIVSLKNTKKPYENDGLIFTPFDGKYTNMLVYKYKPVEKLTVDFLIKQCTQKLLGIAPYIANGKTLYLLFCGVSKHVFQNLRMSLIRNYTEMFSNVNTYNLPLYFPIQFEPSNSGYTYLFWSDDKTLDDKVGEFRYDVRKSVWLLNKIRDDRQIEVARGTYFGNNYKVAESIWMSYYNPLVIEDIAENDKSLIYFQEHDSEIHKPSRNFNSFVKSKLFEQFANSNWIMDMASGKGQDLFRYAKNGVQNVLFLEYDMTALAELISRKHDFADDRNTSSAMSVFVQQMDLTDDYKENIAKIDASKIAISQNGFDNIVCNFAFHYLIESTAQLKNIIRFINHYLKPGGRFMFTAFDGEEVITLLKKHTGKWDALPKFSIRAVSNYEVLQPTGQKIEVLLPFSGTNYYTEYLVNINYISKEFEKAGMNLEIDESFSEYLTPFMNENKNGYKALDDIDKLYTGLYHTYCFYKPIKK